MASLAGPVHVLKVALQAASLADANKHTGNVDIGNPRAFSERGKDPRRKTNGKAIEAKKKSGRCCVPIKLMGAESKATNFWDLDRHAGVPFSGRCTNDPKPFGPQAQPSVKICMPARVEAA